MPCRKRQLKSLSEPSRVGSAALARLIEDWLEKQQQEALEREIIEGCRKMADVYLEIQREFEPLDAEVTRGYYPG